MKILAIGFMIVVMAGSLAYGQTKKPRTLDELAAYTGADRQQILLDGARAEGKVVWYTSLSGVYRDMVDAFKRKYPDIAVDVFRGGSNDLTPRIINEAQAGRPVADALESTPGLLMALRDRGLLKAYVSPELGKFPDEAKGKADGARVFWVTDREAYMGFGYNTRMIAPNEVPKNYQDLLRPELKGKIAVTTESSTSRVIGTMLKYKGEEYIKRLRGSGDAPVQSLERRISRSHRCRRGWRGAGGVSESSDGQEGARRAGGLGAAGRSCGQCRRISGHRECAPSARRLAVYRFRHRRRRTKTDGAVSLRRGVERILFQARIS